MAALPAARHSERVAGLWTGPAVPHVPGAPYLHRISGARLPAAAARGVGEADVVPVADLSLPAQLLLLHVPARLSWAGDGQGDLVRGVAGRVGGDPEHAVLRRAGQIYL